VKQFDQFFVPKRREG